MKRLVLVISIVLGMGINAFAQGGGLFGRGETQETAGYSYRGNNDGMINLPSQHGDNNDANSSPIGSGALLLMGFGAAYMASKKRKN